MKLLNILSKGGNGSSEGKAELNHTLVKLTSCWKNSEERSKLDPLTAKLSLQGEIEEHPIVITKIEYVEEGKEEGMIKGKIYHEPDNHRTWIEMTFDIKDGGTKFRASLTAVKKQV